MTHAATVKARARRPANARRYDTEFKIGDIKIGQRHRKDIGDIDDLAASIKEIGLLQPIGVSPGSVLVFGERRLRACRDVLGWRTIPARVVNLRSILEGEFAENCIRKDWTISERVAIVESLRTFRHGGDRRSDQARNCDDETLTVDGAAKLAGLGGKDGYCRAKLVVEQGVPELVETMDTGQVAVSVAAEVASLRTRDQKSLLSAHGDKPPLTFQQVRKYRRRCRIRVSSALT